MREGLENFQYLGVMIRADEGMEKRVTYMLHDGRKIWKA